MRTRRDELIRRLADVDYLPTHFEPGVTYRITQISAPVFDHSGEVTMMLAVTAIGLELGLPGILQHGRTVRAAADRVTAAIGGAPPAAA